MRVLKCPNCYQKIGVYVRGAAGWCTKCRGVKLEEAPEEILEPWSPPLEDDLEE